MEKATTDLDVQQRANGADPKAARAEDFYRIMIRTRLFEEFCSAVRESDEILANTYPALGEEALGAAGLALTADDVVFPSYRSRPMYFGKGVSAEQQLREFVAGPRSALAGREAPHHASFAMHGMMPSSSMIGGWVPVAAGYALAQHLDGARAVTVCCMGDGVLGAGDLHEALNMVGTWKLPFVLMCENNAYQVASSWDVVRANHSLEAYAEPYGFITRPVDGNDPFDVYQSMIWARHMALAGKPAMLDCHTFRMGGYSSHFTVVRPGADAEIAKWRKRDPIDFIRTWLERNAGMARDELDRIADDEHAEIEAAYRRIQAESKA